MRYKYIYHMLKSFGWSLGCWGLGFQPRGLGFVVRVWSSEFAGLGFSGVGFRCV